ncbi:ATP-binding protein [Lysinibacillus sp. CD3-6]|uniref:ATP-binding protein n=1 Tax=Lysinibacillus sp. CD3-6 TaxID=2892541 RepID=UPI001D17B147|nr:ATP-binding protein [Lysinibacillus sp. CD3-6]UED79286.1 ATP-binding protein [Lysinibacillus sp. CD3-6]
MMKIPKRKLGVITAVDGDLSQVGMYSMSNDAEFLWYGEILNGPKIGAYLTINQNEIKIIATVANEKVVDQQNSIKSIEFDNRYSKSSINRIITLKTKGVIENGEFQVTSQYVPMIGNEVTLTTLQELEIIYGVDINEPTINIGKSILENQPIKLSINKFFASHIGIFGNTGSGKSNTLHKLYLELFKSKYYEQMKNKSQFFVIDFNGEYSSSGFEESTRKGIFGVERDYREIFDINTRNVTQCRKLLVESKYLFDPDILSILFDARPATQVPFLRSALKEFNNKVSAGSFDFGAYVVGTLKKILTSGSAANQDSFQDWIGTAKKYLNNNPLFSKLNQIKQFNGNYKIEGTQIWFNSGSTEAISQSTLNDSGITKISDELKKLFNSLSNEPILQLEIFLHFQKVHRTAWGKVNREHLNPLFNRINTSLDSLSKVIEVKNRAIEDYKLMNIISLVHANQEITRLIPMLLSKMIYDQQKSLVSGKVVSKTKHLIIDEAHNILNSSYKNNGDDWQDYRLSIFEEIIKEGRKFGFYLTLSSQRPADISPTILSQTHNYLIHRLVNEKDLRMLENTMPTLDKSSYQMIPSLGKGEAIITGNAMQVPVFVKIDKEESVRPASDDIILTNLWEPVEEPEPEENRVLVLK